MVNGSKCFICNYIVEFCIWLIKSWVISRVNWLKITDVSETISVPTIRIISQ
jgi:hypothetical protein